MSRKYLLFLLFIFVSYKDIPAQELVTTLCGFVKDSVNNEPLQYATVQIFDSAKINLLHGAITDEKGSFYLEKVPAQKYIAIVSFVGYNKKELTLNMPQSKKTFYFAVKLSPSALLLPEGEIIAEQSGTRVTIDKNIFIPDSITLKNSVTGLDLLNKVPGVNVKKSDQSISLMGNANVLVLIDGVSSGRNLSSIPSEDIERIETINNPSVQYDSDIAHVINVVLKEERKKGLKISTMLVYYTKNKYNFSNMQIDYDFSKFRIFGLYKLRLSNSKTNISAYRWNRNDNVDYEYLNYSEEPSKSRGLGHIFQYGVDYRINKNNLLSFTGNYETYQNESNRENQFSSYAMNNIMQEISLSNSKNSGENNLQNYTLYYKHNFKNPLRELTINSNLYLMRKYSTMNINTDKLYVQDSINEVVVQFREGENAINAINTKIHYIHPFNKTVKMEIGTQFYHRYIKNQYKEEHRETFFDYADYRIAPYGIITYSRDRFSLQGGFRAEFFSINIYDSIHFGQWNYLPSFSALYEINKIHKIKFSIKRTLKYPLYQMLTPFIYYSGDSLTASSGNPYLKPEKYTNFEWNYSYKKKHNFLSSSIYYSMLSDLQGINFSFLDNNILMEKWDNIANTQRFGAYCYGQTVLLGFLIPNIYLDGFYQTFDRKEYNGWSYNISLGLELSLPFDFYLASEATFVEKI